MEYKISKTDLHNDLLADTLHALFDCFHQLHLPLYVVGASARDISFRLLEVDNAARRTLDLDVAVALQQWSEYDALTALLLKNNFVKAKEIQRFYYLGSTGQYRFEVDIVPFGAISEHEQIAWPPEGSPVMSVHCFSDVMNAADVVVVDNVFSFLLASLSGQFLIKLDTWSDRHLTTKKDAFDMVFILKNVYVAYALTRMSLPPEIDIDAEHFDVLVAGAEWIASDLKHILTPEHQMLYAHMLQNEFNQEENSPLINDMLDVSEPGSYSLFRRAVLRMAQILVS